jgi:hypothetical protein
VVAFGSRPGQQRREKGLEEEEMFEVKKKTKLKLPPSRGSFPRAGNGYFAF